MFHNMDRDLLYNFFEGKTSYSEEKQIQIWIETSHANYIQFLNERNIYDTLLLTDVSKQSKNKSHLLSNWILGISAAAILLFIIGGIYLFNLSEKEEQYNTILVPAGQRINLTLSDNTHIWLNANSTFRYPSKFSNETRDVYLDGEAYFEVAKNKKTPFIVKTSHGDIHVTGTSFNVEAYSKYEYFETSLFEGGVSIYKNEILLTNLKPNEKSILKNNVLLVSKIVNVDKYLWRKGLISFNNKTLHDIFTSLEKYFDVDIHFDSSNLPQHKYTGKFRQSEGVDYALRVLQKSIMFNYERDKETGVIYIY